MQPRILFIESDPFLAGVYRTKLQESGYVVEVARDAVAGAQRVASAPPDMVVLDFVLPGMSGLHVIKKIRENPAAQRTRIIVLSNHSTREDIEKSLRAGAHAYLLKSQYTSSELAARIHKIFNA